MIYKTLCNEKISALGYGLMRLPMVDGSKDKADMDKAGALIDRAFELGINYFDSAWCYCGGDCDNIVGKHLSHRPRNTYFVANKFPGYDVNNFPKVKEIFEKQLENCRLDYFDFYLFHNLSELNIEYYLNNEKYGVYDYLVSQKKAGKIKHLGVSVHSSLDTLKRFMQKYGDVIEFCQIQLNWLDWEFQNAKAKVQYLNELGIPVWVMEPVRGGKLINLEEKTAEKMRSFRPDESIASWAFRFIQSVDGVGVTLSGMNTLEQLEDNAKTFSSVRPLSKEEFDFLIKTAKEMTAKSVLPCTSCRYCVNHCTKGLDIPHLISLYNELRYSEGGFLAPDGVAALPEDKRPASCIGCRNCEAVCPQQLKISEAFADFTKRLG